MNKLADHLNMKKQPNFEDDNGDEQAPVSFEFRRNFLDDSLEQEETGMGGVAQRKGFHRRASEPDEPTVDFRLVTDLHVATTSTYSNDFRLVIQHV